MGEEGVVLLAPAIEAALLLGAGPLGWPAALPLQREAHALVAAVLLRRGRLDEIREDSELDPPDRQPGEAAERLGREGHPGIGANSLRQVVGAKEALEDRSGLDQAGAGEA
jgi:hypothetical protein